MPFFFFALPMLIWFVWQLSLQPAATFKYCNWVLRRIFAYPLVAVGVVIVEIGGLLIRIGAWCVDMQFAAKES
jgi:hypothetical protein